MAILWEHQEGKQKDQSEKLIPQVSENNPAKHSESRVKNELNQMVK